MKAKKTKKIVVAMSGGVDSSVAAALLKRAGVDEFRSSSRFANARVFDVIGAFMKLANLPRFKEGEKKAKEVAKILGIPLLILDLRKEFKKRIVDYFLKNYKLGLTPNPCVVCNKEIKFGLLLEKALALNADFVATGHYARKIQNPKSKIQHLLRAKDKNKDQSYFLWKLNQEQLKKTLFPIGNYTRKEVENLARKFKLPVLKARKSVEICFIYPHTITSSSSAKIGAKGAKHSFGVGVKTTINDFLRKYLKLNPGRIVDTQGKVIGGHQGLWFYTIGQRKGIKLPGGPYYVLDKNLKKNFLIVTKNEKDLFKKELFAKNINWISGEVPRFPLRVRVKIRYRHEPASAQLAQIHTNKNTDLRRFVKVKFDKAQRAVTPGQSVVFYQYQGQEILGGGIIC